jgi:hypothetical protein
LNVLRFICIIIFIAIVVFLPSIAVFLRVFIAFSFIATDALTLIVFIVFILVLVSHVIPVLSFIVVTITAVLLIAQQDNLRFLILLLLLRF